MNYILYPAIKLDFLFELHQTPSNFAACLFTSEKHHKMFSMFENNMADFFDADLQKFTTLQMQDLKMTPSYALVNFNGISGVFRCRTNTK
jgi:hypothetical protein